MSLAYQFFVTGLGDSQPGHAALPNSRKHPLTTPCALAPAAITARLTGKMRIFD